MSFVEHGFVSLGTLSPEKCADLLRLIRIRRDFSPALFMDETAFTANPQRKGVNPEPGRNILETVDHSFVLENPGLREYLRAILGPITSILSAKLVAAVPEEWIPEWVQREIHNTPVPNLGAFIKPEYRDITYFHGIDWHQDLIDYPDRFSDFVTVYVYLNSVGEDDSPLNVIPGSHRRGAAVFPHDMSDYDGLPREVLTGWTGATYLWHPCTLHGTQPTQGGRVTNRVSLRYVIAKPQHTHGVLDVVNRNISGPLSLSSTRTDLGDAGEPIIKGNGINGT